MLQSFLFPQLAEFDYAFTDTAFFWWAAQVCTGSLAEVLSGSAVFFMSGQNCCKQLIDMGLTTELRLVFGFL